MHFSSKIPVFPPCLTPYREKTGAKIKIPAPLSHIDFNFLSDGLKTVQIGSKLRPQSVVQI